MIFLQVNINVLWPIVVQHSSAEGKEETQLLYQDASITSLTADFTEGYKIVNKDNTSLGIIAVNGYERRMVKKNEL